MRKIEDLEEKLRGPVVHRFPMSNLVNRVGEPPIMPCGVHYRRPDGGWVKGSVYNGDAPGQAPAKPLTPGLPWCRACRVAMGEEP